MDNYGDGALVLMDDNKEAGDKSIFHYRLFCTDEELRKNRYLTVYPNEPGSNSTYSFSLQTRYGAKDASTYNDVSQYWSSEDENDRGVFSSDEKFFTYPINDKNLSEKYYVIPYLTDTDVFGQKLDTSEVWYYNTPVDAYGREIPSFTFGYSSVKGTVNYNGNVYNGTIDQNEVTADQWKNAEKSFVSGSVKYKETSNLYRNNIKWITYKIYKVDPLTRRNISTVFGADQPVKEVCYGAASDEALKCRLPLNKLGINYKAGEMYRVEMDVDEYLGYNGTLFRLDTASCRSSIVFMCYDTNEYKPEGGKNVPDFTPVQWLDEPKSGKKAKIQIVNGQAGLIDYQYRKIFDVYYQWYEVNPNGDDILIAGTDNIFRDKIDTFTADLNGLRDHNFRQMLPGQDGFKYVNTVDPNDPKASQYGSNGLPADTSKWTVDMLHSYLEADTPEALLTKNSSYTLTPQNNKTMATNTDTCYIPEACEGKTVYCKVTAVNNYWLRNFDHVQVFYSHKVTVPIETKPLSASISAVHSGDYATYENPVTISLTDITNLDPDEVVTKVQFCTNGGKTITFEDLSVKDASSVKSITYPKDFFSTSNSAQNCAARPDLNFYAKIYTNKGRFYKTNTEVVDYEVEAKDLDFEYPGYYFYEGIYHRSNESFVDEVSIKVTPRNASIGYSLKNGESFTTTDPDVATFDGKGQLVAGTKEGRTTVTLNCPSGETKTLVIANPIPSVKISGISAPVVGQKFDLTADVPEGANYSVKEVWWSEQKWGDRLPADAVAEAFRSYTAHIVIRENNGQEFNTDDYSYWVNGAYEHFIDLPYTLTATLEDGTEDIVSGTLHGDDDNVWKAGRQNTVEAIYSFPASSGGQKNCIDTISITYPVDVQQGDDIKDWADQFEIVTGAEGTYTTKIIASGSQRSEDLWEAKGYVTAPDVFMKGSQTGLSVQLSIKDNLSVTFPENKSDIKVFINGVERNDVEILNTTKYLAVSAYNCINIADGIEIAPPPVFNIESTSMIAGESVNLSDIVTTNVPELEYRLSDTDISNDYYDYYAATNFLVTKAATPAEGVALNGYVMWDVNGDGKKETKFNRQARLTIFASENDLPDDDNVKVTFRMMKPDGTQDYSVNRYITKETSTGKASALQYLAVTEPENAVISSIDCSLGEYSDDNPEVSYRYGAGRINTSKVRTNRTYTINTVPADSINIYPGKDKVYAAFDGELQGINISIDGETFYSGSYIEGLNPDTEYTLYYRQGVDGTVYSKQFRTASTDYGVAVGKSIVTELNTGNLERDGWHYDTSTNTLTLKNYSVVTSGTVAEVEKFVGYNVNVMNSAIYSSHDLIVELIGENNITKLKSGSMSDAAIYANGDLTLTGNGDLNICGYSENTIQTTGLYSAAGDIHLRSNGKVTFRKIAAGIDISYSNRNTNACYYYSGEYLYTPLYMTKYSSPFYNGSLFNANYTFNISGKTHVINVYTGENGFDETLAEESNAVSAITSNAKFVHIQPIHSCTKKVVAAEYFVEGNCEKGATYYKSCSCGYTNKSATFTVSGQDHSYEYFDAKTPTCTEDGWKAYKVCTKCGDTDFEAVPAAGHQFVHHDAKAATCTEAGWEEYDECTVCGMTTRVDIPATDHSLVHHPAQAPTCTAVGWDAYDTCENCSYTTYHELPMTAHELVHHDGKEPTETESGWEPYDDCKNCDYTTYTVIPALGTSEPLVNNSEISRSTVKPSTPVILTGKASGGKAPYTYAFYYKKSASKYYSVLGTEFGTADTASLKPSAEGTYDIKIDVKDGNGTVVSKAFVLTVSNNVSLVNTSAINSEIISVGTRIRFTGAATGGNAPYTYTYSYKRTTSAKWTVLGAEYGTVDWAVMTPNSVGTFDIKISVKDADGEIADKSFVVKVADGKSKAFKNESTLSATGAKPKTRIYVYGAASGSAGYTYAFYYKRTTARAWTILGTEFGTSSVGAFTPGKEGEFNMKIDIKDENGEIVSKLFALSISNDYTDTTAVNNSTISATSAKPGTKITLTGAASGGTGDYTYAFYYKKAQASNWSTIGTPFGTATTAGLTLKNVGDYIFKVAVRDANGMVSKNFNVEITNTPSGADLSNNSTISAATVAAGSPVTVTGAASGGKAPYTYAFYYKKSTANVWNLRGTEFGADTSASITFKNAGSYNMKAIVKDADGNTSEKIFELTVS